MRFDQLNEAKPETLAVGCAFCMTQMEDAMKARSMEEKMRVREHSELIADSNRRGREQVSAAMLEGGNVSDD